VKENRELLTMLSNQRQNEITEKLDKLWRSLDELFILKEVLEMMDQQLNNTPFTFDPREERMQLLLNIYKEKFEIHFDDSRKVLLEIEKILRQNPRG
jgi:mRNA degradation ribonuclease J1/J2